MRHKMAGRKLGRVTEHRRALFRNQLKSLIEHERIVTTLPKAKELGPIAEKVVTLAREKDSVHARRQAARWLTDRDLVARLFTVIGPRFVSRPGGYTRIVKLGPRRGDGGELAILETAPIFVHHYPVEIKAFYMKPDPEDPTRALNDDMLAPEGYGEVIGGSQRLDDLNLLLKRIDEHKLPREAFDWYLDLRKYGSVPHSGFGIGLERTVSWVCGLEHVRETIPFARMLSRLRP